MDIHIILDRHTTVAYMVKHTSKGERSGRSLQNIYRSVMQNAHDIDNPVSMLIYQMIRCVDRRDVRGCVASRMIFGGKHCQSSLNLVRQFLEVSTQQLRIDKATGEVITADNLLTLFAKRAQFSRNFPI